MATQDQTASELIAACLQTGSESAWRDLVLRFQPLIASVILRVVRRYDDQDLGLVDDLVQETFLRLCRNDSKVLRQFDHRHETATFAFMKVVAASVANDHFRGLHAQKRAGEYAVDSDILDRTALATGPRADDRLLMLDIQRSLEQVTESPGERSIFWLYYRQGFSAVDIAAMPGIALSAKGVESCLLRLVKALKLKLSTKVQPENGLQSSSALREV